MKWLILLVLLTILTMIIWRRFRLQIETAIYIFRMFRKMRQMSKAETTEKQIEKTSNSNDVQLVRCAKCGSWTPQSNALKFGAKSFYCSANCMEKAVVSSE